MAANNTKQAVSEPGADPISKAIDKYQINGVNPLNIDSLKTNETNKPINNGNKGKIQPGQVLNPNGRPKGSLNKIKSLFYDDLYNDWDKHGNQAIIDLRESSPVKYCQMVASILPRSIELDDTGNVQWVINAQPNLSIEQWQDQHGIKTIEHDKDQ